MMTEDPYSSDGFGGPHSKRPKLSENNFSEKFDNGKKSTGFPGELKNNSTTVLTPIEDVDGASRQQYSTTISFNINSVDSEKLSSPSSMTALSTSSTSTDESGYQSGGNSSTPQPSSVTSNVSMNGVFSSNTNLGFSSQGGQVSVVMTNMQTSGFSSQMPTANVNFNINKQFIPNPNSSAVGGGNMYHANGPQNPSVAFNITSSNNNNNNNTTQFVPMGSAAVYHQSSGPAPGRSYASPPVDHTASQKDTLTRQQLIFFFCHSSVCIVKNANNSRPASTCKVPHCSQSRMILQHLQQCANSRFCGVPSCQGLRWARDHYSNCKNMSCIYCEPVRRNRPAFATNNAQNNISSTNDSLKRKLKEWIMSDEPLRHRSDNSSSSASGAASVGRRNPRFELNDKTRLSCIANMVSAIIPSNTDSAQGCLLANDEQAQQVIYLTRQVEVDVYYEAISRDNYFEMMARKSYEFQKRMDELQKKQEAVAPATAVAANNPVVNNNSSGGQGLGCTIGPLSSSQAMPTSIHMNTSNDVMNQCEPVSSNGSILSSLLNNSRPGGAGTDPQPQQQQLNSASNANSVCITTSAASFVSSSGHISTPLQPASATGPGCYPGAIHPTPTSDHSSLDSRSNVNATAVCSSASTPVYSNVNNNNAHSASISHDQSNSITTSASSHVTTAAASAKSTNNSSVITTTSADKNVSPVNSTTMPVPDGVSTNECKTSSESSSTSETDPSKEITGHVKQEPVVKDEPMDTLDANVHSAGIKKEHNDVEMKAEPASEPKESSDNSSPNDKTESSSPSSNVKKEPDTDPVKTEVHVKKFSLDEIRQSLWPVLQHIIGQPESEPFRVPVDYESLGLTDYPEVVKEPMDISTIRRNMFDEEKYCDDPWVFVSHMQLMFANAWLYNRKATKIYKSTTRLSEIFYERIDEAMRNLGFCCGQHLTFSPIPIYCYQKLCHIPRDAKYFVWTNTAPKTGILSEKYIYCAKCFNETSVGLDLDEFPVSDEPGVPGAQVLNVHKTAFEQVTNNSVECEKFIKCCGCGRNWHVICAMYLPAISKEFHCPTCLRLHHGIHSGLTLHQSQELAKFSASRLPTNKMASFIERNVNKFLKPNDCPHVSIRVLSCSTKMAEVQPKMQARFPEYPKQFPYRHKALFAFTQVDNRDVCIFGMTVQEYGSDCPQPNTRRVYLSYLDSVFFFEPRRLRTALYHRILIAYFDYCKQLGYDYAHIWACPPGEGDDYIFHCHPPEQKTPKPKRLQDWYKLMLDQAQGEGVIEDYRDVQKACEDASPSGFTSATQLPYFEGDYWPKVLEDLITQVGDSNKGGNNSGNGSNNVNSSSSNNGPGSNGGNAGSANQVTAPGEEEIHSVESDPAMTPGAHDGDVGANTPSADHMQSCGTPNPPSVDEVASTPPSNAANESTSANGANKDTSTEKTQKQPRKKSKKWSGNSSSRHKQRKQATLDLTEKVIQNMNSCRDSFFTIRLQTYKQQDEMCSDSERSPNDSISKTESNSSARKKIEDPDPDVHYEMMEGRDSFLHMSREKYWEFSSLRRARYSSMCMLHELHTAGNSLCTESKKDGQGTKADGTSGASSGTSGHSKAEIMNQYIKVMVHATTCRNANCTNPPQCAQFKKLLSHAKSCAQRTNQQKSAAANGNTKTTPGCVQCTNLFKMFIKHAETCNKGTQPCSVPYCQDIRRRNSRQDLMLRRRMAMMMQRTNSGNASSNNAPPTPQGGASNGASSPIGNNSSSNYMNNQPRTPYAPSPISVKDQTLSQPATQSVVNNTSGGNQNWNSSNNCTTSSNGQQQQTQNGAVINTAGIGLNGQQQPQRMGAQNIGQSSQQSNNSSQMGNNNPPPGALEAAQRAKTMAAMQSSSSQMGYMSAGGTVVTPNNPLQQQQQQQVYTSLPMGPVAASLPSYQQPPNNPTMSNAPPMSHHPPPTPIQAMGNMQDPSGTPLMYHHPAMDAGPNGGAMYVNGPVVSSYGPGGHGPPQMMMMSPHQQAMIRGSPGGPMYYAGSNGQIQIAQMQMGGHPMRGAMIRGGPMPGMGMMGGPSAMHHPSQMIMSGAYPPQFGGPAPQGWRPGMPGGPPGAPHPSRMQIPVGAMRAQAPGAGMVMMNPNGPAPNPGGGPQPPTSMGPMDSGTGQQQQQPQQKFIPNPAPTMSQNPAQNTPNQFASNGPAVGQQGGSTAPGAVGNNLTQHGGSASLNSGETLQKFADTL